jgi:hypothetical protein
VLAWLQDEPGADAAEPWLMEGVITADAAWAAVEGGPKVIVVS